MITRVLLPCCGLSTRWDAMFPIKKHLVDIDGERLLDRTVRQIKERCPAEVVILSHNADLWVNGAVGMSPQETMLPDSGLGHAMPLFVPGVNVVLLGDVCFTDRAMDAVFTTDAKIVQWFGRFGPSNYGHRWGELFGMYVPPEGVEQLKSAVATVRAGKEAGDIMKVTAWMVYRLMNGFQLHEHAVGPNFTEINDETDDFDCVQDYARWRILHKKNTAKINH